MRIEYLSLPAFGMFTDQTIRFPAEYGLHIIYGPMKREKAQSCGRLAMLCLAFPTTRLTLSATSQVSCALPQA